MFVVMEFTGFARQYNIRNILTKFAPGAAILEIDPLAVFEDYCWDNGERVARICKEIVDAAPAQVALIGYCAGCDLARQVAAELSSSGVLVTGCALLDPVAVTSAFIYDALAEIADSLGRRNISAEDYEALHLADASLCDRPRVENILLSWTSQYAADALGVSADSEPLIEQLAERYISWISYLCATAWANGEMFRPFAVFTSDEGLTQLGYSASFPGDGFRSYATQPGAPCLTADQCILDFGSWAVQAAGEDLTSDLRGQLPDHPGIVTKEGK